MNNITLLSAKRSHKFDTGIDRYSNELMSSFKSFPELSITKKIIQKPSKFKVLNNILFNFKAKKTIKNQIIHLLAPVDISSYKIEGNLITTIHDICPLILPDVYPFYTPYLFKKNIESLIKQKSYFIANSSNTKKDLISYFNIPSERVFVTPLGVSEKFVRPAKQDIIKILKKYYLPDQYFLFTGSMNRRKNLKNIIKSFVIFKSRFKTNTKLVLAGRMNWGGSVIKKIVEKNNLTNEIILPGYIDDKDLPAVISAAKAVLYLSLYEGFGLPCIEAMKVGTPLIVSNVSSIPEVVGNAAILVDPHKVDDISIAMNTIVSKREFCEKLIQKGLIHSKNFLWENTAKKTLEAYNKILNYQK